MDITNLTYLFYGYTAAFIVIAAFVLLLVSRSRLKAMVEDREKA
jgi:hypothetical protein